MSLELFRRMKLVEARLAELEKKIKEQEVVKITPAGEAMMDTKSRGMCPKCGVKPNHFFHVKNCRGQQQKDDDRNRDPGTS